MACLYHTYDSCPRAGLGPRIASGAAQAAYRRPLCLNPAGIRGSGGYAQGARTGHFVMIIGSYKTRATHGRRTGEAEGPVPGFLGTVARQTAYAAAGAEPWARRADRFRPVEPAALQGRRRP